MNVVTMTTNLNVTRNWCLKRIIKKRYIYIFLWGGWGAIGISPRASNWLELPWLHGNRSGRMSLKCVFGCEGKITLFSFPKNPAFSKQWMQLVFPGQQMSFSSVFVDERFINKAQFDGRIAHRLILKDGAFSAIKEPSHDSELQKVTETASNVSVLLAIDTHVLVTL